MQLRRRPLTAAEFVAPLSKIDPIYKEEEEAYTVSELCVPLSSDCACVHTSMYILFPLGIIMMP